MNRRIKLSAGYIVISVVIVCFGMCIMEVQADYPSSTTTPLAVDLNVNGKSVYNIGDFSTKGPWADVREWGATGNGTTNDTTAIVNAVNYVSGLGGGIVFFPRGTYLITSQIPLKSNIQYIGIGMDATVIKLGAACSGFSNYPATGPQDAKVKCRVANLTIDGNYNNIPDGGNDNYQIGIYAEMVNDSVFESIEINNMWYVGIEIYNNATNNIVKNCRFDNVGDKPTIVGGYYYAVGVDFGSSYNIVENNLMNTCGSGIHVSGGTGIVNHPILRGNRILNPKDYGISIKDYVIAPFIESNYIYHPFYSGIELFCTNTQTNHTITPVSTPWVIGNIIDTANIANVNGVQCLGIAGVVGTAVVAFNKVLNINATANTIGIGVTRGYLVSGELAESHAIIMGNEISGTFPGYAAIYTDGTRNQIIDNNINGAATGIKTTVMAIDTIVNANTTPNCTTPFVDEGANTQRIHNLFDPAFTYGSAAPSTRTWTQGDIVYNTAPTPTGPVGWKCTASGTPGTWVPFGGQAAAQANSTATTVTALKNDFNALLSKLRAAGLMAP